MNPDTEQLAQAWGVAFGYHDLQGRWVEADRQAVAAVLEAMGAAPGRRPPASRILFASPGEQLDLAEPHDLITEDGALLRVEQKLPLDLPHGYHQLCRLRDGEKLCLVVAPLRCHLPDDLFTWGWAVQLPAIRSAASWGMGDLADLRRLSRWSRSELGAGVVLINPLHASLPLLPQEPSPYYPASRRFRNPLYLRVEEVQGAERLGAQLEPLVREGRALNQDRTIDRDRVFELKMRALEILFQAFSGDPDFDRYLQREGGDLEDYATFCAISERHGRPWQSWPFELQHPQRSGVRRFREANRQRVRFHQWLQWLLDCQLAAAATEIDLVNDLAVGVRPDGADTWAWQDVFAAGVTVGAPPDPFNRAGQDWGLAPFDPWRLREAGYQPLIQTLRGAFRHGAGLRLDHVMGLFRLFWIPPGARPEAGVYVRYPHFELLALLALESERAGAFVVGEDLGTVEDWVREELARRQMLSYRLVWFEERPPSSYPREALAALGTHDLPTLAGIWTGADPLEEVKERLQRQVGLSGEETLEQVAETLYRALASSPCRLLAASFEDALGIVERPNRPGTTSGWPNWSLALPLSLEQLERDPRPARVARWLAREARQ